MNILCTICARKGSKGLKNKNIANLKGKPLVLHTLDQAKKIKISERYSCVSQTRKLFKKL